jgi:aminopeptidase N
VIGEVWERRTSEIAQNVVVGLFPDEMSREVVDAAEDFLADPAVPPALRRLVAEGRDDTVRGLAGRARDAAAG